MAYRRTPFEFTSDSIELTWADDATNPPMSSAYLYDGKLCVRLWTQMAWVYMEATGVNMTSVQEKCS